jgi:plasmid stabilization system protein ParE
MRVRYTLRARADLEAIFSYLDSRNPAAALGLKRQMERAAAALSFAPPNRDGSRPIA